MNNEDPIHAPLGLPDQPAPQATERDRAFDWVPIRALSARHRPRILEHFLALGQRDRYLRFGSVATDAQITHYVDLIDFDTDEVLGIFNRRLELLAVAHLAYGPVKAERSARASAEFGVSVAERARGRSYGTRLFERAALHARNHGVTRLRIHALSENQSMLAIARKAGAYVVRDGSESRAEVMLPPSDLGSHVEQFVEETAAEVDFHLKSNARRVDRWLAALARQDGA
jgi:RimJ/RimL family protein N-acetyltransferase